MRQIKTLEHFPDSIEAENAVVLTSHGSAKLGLLRHNMAFAHTPLGLNASEFLGHAGTKTDPSDYCCRWQSTQEDIQMKALWLSLGTALVLCQPAVAGHVLRKDRIQQESTTQPQPPTQTEPLAQTPAQPSIQSQQTQNLSQQLVKNLQDSGFKNIKIMPESFLIRAKDQQGNPIEMVVSPTSVAAVEIGRWQGYPATGRSAAVPSSQKFMRGPIFDAMNANLADTNVQSSDQKNIGVIKGIAIGEDGLLSYVVAVDNNRDIAVSPAAMSLSYDDNADKWNATVDATKQQIASAPQVQYSEKQ